MSASLVGSEMCIRDRSALRRDTPALTCLKLPPSVPSGLKAVFGGLRRVCLLYTSDAADDM
eukprot:4441217-Alexandrium_andersonii.AAC.1